MPPWRPFLPGCLGPLPGERRWPCALSRLPGNGAFSALFAADRCEHLRCLPCTVNCLAPSTSLLCNSYDQHGSTGSSFCGMVVFDNTSISAEGTPFFNIYFQQRFLATAIGTPMAVATNGLPDLLVLVCGFAALCLCGSFLNIAASPR